MRRDGSVGRLLSRAFGALVLLIVCAGLAEMTTVLLQHRVVDQLSTHVQPLQLANAYATLGAQGTKCTPSPERDTRLAARSCGRLAK